ncbi:MAG: Benzylsuccinate synthase alpha subunit [Lentisphaerae bacterium ADurb.Bin082]|nr:MAG: Benzylsuccinate synthase alpha subunit [Lentisphaerae bacterium ADurb.Bin082]
MNERIARLEKKVREEEIYPPVVAVSYDAFDEKLAEPMRIAKRLTEYMAAQPVVFSDDNELVGLMRFDGSVESDLFPRTGHTKIREAFAQYYNKPQENLCTMEWQHSNQDFGKLLRIGLKGLRAEVVEARKLFIGNQERLNFLAAFEMMIRGMARRADQNAAACREAAAKCTDPIRKKTLLRMAANCAKVPMNPASSFEEAVQAVYFNFHFLADSIGRPDQYLYPYYQQGIADGTLSRERAKELLQELFIMIHGWTPITSSNRDRGAESHFVIGGYTIDHEDGFNELSDLILDAMLECDLIRPQVSLRWNKKTPREVLYKVMDCSRKDKNKRFAFVNDEPRINAFLKIRKLPWEEAYDYIMVGCNEPAFQGGISLGGNTVNIVRSLVNTLNDRRQEILECEQFDDFYEIFQQELFRDLDTILDYSNRFNMLRSRDCNVLSSLFLEGCIQRAQSATRGGAARAMFCAHLMGGTNLIDSLIIIKQFVFEEKRVSMQELLTALDQDWEGFENLRGDILRHGKFFGNNDDFSNAMARRFHTSLYEFAQGRTDIYGFPLLFGNLTGYNWHFARYGALTQATPDGRVAGSALLFGSGQAEGKDRDGATSQLLAAARMDPTGIMCGDTIMNLSVEEKVVQNDESFDKLVSLVETYFQAGGLHIQLNHVSREDLLAAKTDPNAYKSLRVRVSGFSATFIKLDERIQDNVIARTEYHL